MELTNIRDLFRDKEMYLDKEISVGGWVRSVRGSKTFGFIVVNDGTFFEPLQVVYGDHLEMCIRDRDALMVGIWFFCLFAFLDSMLYYAVDFFAGILCFQSNRSIQAKDCLLYTSRCV